MTSSESDEFEVIDQLEASLSPEELVKVQLWLQPTDYDAQSSEFHRHLSSQAPGTGLWICETSKYQQWQNSADHGSLWVKGAPGAGKSVTAASMIEHLRKHDDTPILYFFFRYIISANRRPRSLIRDFLAQLLPHSIRLQATLQPLVGTDLDDFSDEILWEHFLTGLSSIKKAYCVVDALDEMELVPSDRFLNRLNDLVTFRPNVKLLMTSRPKQYLQSGLRDTSIVHISLEDDLVGKDIGLFVSYRLKSVLPDDSQRILRESLASKIAERSRGLFLYARLLLDQIIPSLKSTALDVENLMKTIPVGLEEMYNSMLLRQAKSLGIDIKIQVFLLEMATHSSRALRLNELANALASCFPSSMIPNTPKSLARSACAPLLEISEDETVQVIHHSFTEFLLDNNRAETEDTSQFPVLNPENVHKKLTIICLDYLRSGVLRPESVSEKDGKDDRSKEGSNDEEEIEQYDYREAKLRYPFLEYAVKNWAFHASKYDVDDDEFFQSLAAFLDPHSLDFKKWLELEWWRKDPERRLLGYKPKNKISTNVQPPSPLHIATFAGLTKHAKKLMLKESSMDLRDSEDRTPLHWACARGHTAIAALLLEHGADPNPEDCRGVKPIHEAARKNHALTVALLLKVGVDPLTPKTKEDTKGFLMCGETVTKGETAVEYAWLQGHTDTIMEMLPYISQKTLAELFCQCCRYGKLEAVRAIIRATDISPNTEWKGTNALYLACRAKNVAIVEMLIAKGADVHRMSKWLVPNRNACGHRETEEPLRAPIHAVIMDWKASNNVACQQLLRLLLNGGADLEVKDDDGDTPLLSLFSRLDNADDVVVKGLLQAGADARAVDKNGNSIVQRYLACDSRNIQTLKMLFEYGASPKTIGEHGDTIIHSVLRTIQRDKSHDFTLASIKFLIEKGTPCDVRNKRESTAVEYAANNSMCQLDTFIVLLRACSDEDARKRCTWKLSGRDTKEETVKYIRELQKLGVSLEERDDKGRTVLLTSVGSTDLFDAFIECGADVNAVDSESQGVLHHYITYVTRSRGRLNDHTREHRLVQLVNMGLDPLKVDDDGNNLLHIYSKHYEGIALDNSIVQRLLSYGISVNSKNSRGMTPLHIHLENWDFHSPKATFKKDIHERFDERFTIPLLKVFRRSEENIDINHQDADGLTIFHLAALRSLPRLFYLLEQGADPNLLTKNGRNALHLASRARESNIVEYLCQSKIGKSMINQRDSYGRTPLHDACTSGYSESVRHLLAAGADITILDNKNRTPLHSCADFSDEERIWTLLRRRNEETILSFEDRFRLVQSKPHGPWYSSNREEDDSSISPSIASTIESLLLAGSDTAATDSSYRTPLDLAIEYDCQEMIQTLQFSVNNVFKNWSLDTKDQTLPTVIAMSNPYLSGKVLAEMPLTQIVNNPSRYLRYMTLSDLEWVSKNGGNITGRDEGKPILSSGKSLLYIAASNGFKHLIESFGHLARANDRPEAIPGQTVELFSDPEKYPQVEYLIPTLHVACGREFSNFEVIKVLIDTCGVDVNARAMLQPTQWKKAKEVKELVKGGTALHVLAEAKHWWQLGSVKYLIQKGANINSVNEKGETPLHIACTGPQYADMNCTQNAYGYWRIDCVKALLDQGADINHLDNDGLSCLQKASTSPQILRILLEHGMALNVGSISPVFPAIQMQCLETLTILLDAGVDPNIMDQNTDKGEFKVHYKAEKCSRWALFCATFPGLQNQREKHSAPLVKLLINQGADLYAPLIKEKTKDKLTLVHYAFEHAEYDILAGYLDCASKIDFDTRDQLGRTVFLAACEWREVLPGYRHRHWEAKAMAPFLKVLGFGADPLVVDNKGRNALHCLLDTPEIEDETIVQFLSHDVAKILIRQKDGNGFTPLHCALRILRPTVVETLLSMGEDLLHPDPTGATALHRIAEQCLFVTRELTQLSWGNDHKPEFYTRIQALWKKYLALGGSINVRDNKGSPPLFYYLASSQRGNYRTPEDSCCHAENFATYFSEEVTGGFDVHAKNHDGENALHIIARREKNNLTKPKHDKHLYELFVGKGLNPLEEDGKGRSSLDVAAACEQTSILELFQYGK